METMRGKREREGERKVSSGKRGDRKKGFGIDCIVH